MTGHVDDTAKVEVWQQSGKDWLLEVRPDPKWMPFLVYKGSVALNGISLTVAEVLEDRFQVWIIPHTLTCTNLRTLQVGGLLNLEVDILGKYVERFLSQRSFPDRSS